MSNNVCHPRFFDNPAFRHYVKQLYQLHLLYENGADQTSEADVLRDEMDVSYEDLTQDEIHAVNGISADFYTLSDPKKEFVRNSTAEFRRAMKKGSLLKSQGDFNSALRLMREYEPFLSSALAAAMRGSIWRDLKEPEIALHYHRKARDLEPSTATYQQNYLVALSEQDFSEARREAMKVINDRNNRQPVLRIAAINVAMLSVQKIPDKSSTETIGELLSAAEDLIAEVPDPLLDPSSAILFKEAVSAAGMCAVLAGNADKALDYYEQGLIIDPRDEMLLTLRGILLYGRNTLAAVESLEEAVRLYPQAAWPLYLLSHHHLIRGEFRDCLKYVELAITTHPTPSRPLLANLYQSLAICRASLGDDVAVVREAFDKAAELDPTNQDVKQNRELFEESVHSRSPGIPKWKAADEAEIREFGHREFRIAA